MKFFSIILFLVHVTDYVRGDFHSDELYKSTLRQLSAQVDTPSNEVLTKCSYIPEIVIVVDLVHYFSSNLEKVLEQFLSPLYDYIDNELEGKAKLGFVSFSGKSFENDGHDGSHYDGDLVLHVHNVCARVNLPLTMMNTTEAREEVQLQFIRYAFAAFLLENKNGGYFEAAHDALFRTAVSNEVGWSQKPFDDETGRPYKKIVVLLTDVSSHFAGSVEALQNFPAKQLLSDGASALNADIDAQCSVADFPDGQTLGEALQVRQIIPMIFTGLKPDADYSSKAPTLYSAFVNLMKNAGKTEATSWRYFYYMWYFQHHVKIPVFYVERLYKEGVSIDDPRRTSLLRYLVRKVIQQKPFPMCQPKEGVKYETTVSRMTVTLEAPFVQSSTAQYSYKGIETFDALPVRYTGTYVSDYGLGPLGTIKGNYTNLVIHNADEWGGAGGKGRYAAVPMYETLKLQLTQTGQLGVTSFSFWLSGADRGNVIEFFSFNHTLEHTWTTGDIRASVDRNSDYFGNPNIPPSPQKVMVQPFVCMVLKFENVAINEIWFHQTEVGGWRGKLETDMHVVGEIETQKGVVVTTTTTTPPPVGCSFSKWSPWSECSVPCSRNGVGGVQTRSRNITAPPEFGGSACLPLEETQEGCNEEYPCPVDCSVSGWSGWSLCSLPCSPDGVGGVQKRSRNITAPAEPGGKSCPHLQETETGCNKEFRCPVDCSVSSWSGWSPCSVPCSPDGVGGDQTRSRNITAPDQFGGKPCPHLLETEKGCNKEFRCPVDCSFSNWSAWSPCSVPCSPDGVGGVQTRSRNITAPDQFGGKPCPHLQETETGCNKEFRCHKHINNQNQIKQDQTELKVSEPGPLAFEAATNEEVDSSVSTGQKIGIGCGIGGGIVCLCAAALGTAKTLGYIGGDSYTQMDDTVDTGGSTGDKPQVTRDQYHKVVCESYG